MCRLFGFRSVIQSQVHRSLVSAENALAVQSERHPHGWGVAYYRTDVPHVIKSADSAFEDHIFRRVSGIVASETVLAHVRRATVGPRNILNSHPFQYGRWVFAHNGEVHAFERVREALSEEVAPVLRRYILGDTDSEVVFYLFLTALSRRADLEHRGTPLADVVAALDETFQRIREVADGPGDDEKSSLTVCVTDGQAMVGHRGRQLLHYSTYKSRCFDRESCPYLAHECEAPTRTGHVNHLIISSEPNLGDNTWMELADGEYVGVDWRMHLYRGRSGTLEAVGRRTAAAATGASG
jgi:glutamine amidotransferase